MFEIKTQMTVVLAAAALTAGLGTSAAAAKGIGCDGGLGGVNVGCPSPPGFQVPSPGADGYEASSQDDAAQAHAHKRSRCHRHHHRHRHHRRTGRR